VRKLLHNQADLAEHCLHLQNIWLHKDATKLLTTSPKSSTEAKPTETKPSDMHQSMPAPLFEQTVDSALPQVSCWLWECWLICMVSARLCKHPNL
jgi:hypothetical protein